MARKTQLYDEAHPGQRASADAPPEPGGFRPAVAFFGWLVAVAVTVLLTGIISVIAGAVGVNTGISRTEAEQEAATIGIAGAVVLLIVLTVAYFAGGYVAGRMARFNGARQGVGVWGIGVIVTIIVAALGAIFGTQYGLFQQIEQFRIPVPVDMLTVGGAITLVVVLAATLLAAAAGGKAGQRYHAKLDRARA